MTLVVTQEAAMDALRDAVAEKGAEYVYPENEKIGISCSYVWDGRPSCIVGNALHRLGVSLDILGRFEMTTAASVLDSLRYRKILVVDTETRQAYDEAQTAQDDGRPWGEALAAAEESLPVGTEED